MVSQDVYPPLFIAPQMGKRADETSDGTANQAAMKRLASMISGDAPEASNSSGQESKPAMKVEASDAPDKASTTEAEASEASTMVPTVPEKGIDAAASGPSYDHAPYMRFSRSFVPAGKGRQGQRRSQNKSRSSLMATP